MTAENETEPSSKDYSMLPPDAYELIGKAVSERLNIIIAEYRVEIAELKAVVAQHRAEIAEYGTLKSNLVSGIVSGVDTKVSEFLGAAAKQMSETMDVIDGRLSEIKDGKDGSDGKDGLQGEKGEPGPRGETGERGESGEAGKDGAPGEPGNDGAPGERGEKGDPGEVGEKGDPGQPGAVGERGEKGDSGERGEKGDPGVDGKDGVITTKVAAYKDVWKDGEVYGLGDFVTLGGSLWHCNAPTWTNEKPGTTETWTLAVKRGRDGKDGKDGTPGAKGDKGDVGHYKGILQDDAGKS
jgi:hypothetical protein